LETGLVAGLRGGLPPPAGRQERNDCLALFLIFRLLKQTKDEILLRNIINNQQRSKDDQQGDDLDQVHIYLTSFRSPARRERTASPAGLGNERYLSQWTPEGVNRLPVKVPSTGLVAGGKWLSGSCTRKAACPPADNEKTRWKPCFRMSNGRCGRLTTLGRRARVGRSCRYSSKFFFGAQVVCEKFV